MPSENYILLERTELNASAASVTFANIPQSGYTDLKIVISARYDQSSDNAVYLQFNGNTSSSYSYRYLFGSGSAASSASASGDIRANAGIAVVSTYTASTFSNSEIYIPNYLSSTAKSFSADNVQENNATTAFSTLVAGLWNPGTQAAISSITLFPASGNIVAGSTFSLYGIAAVGTTPAIAPKASGGNIIDYDGTYWIHTFTSSGTFTPQTGLTCDVLVVAGGGGSGAGYTNNSRGGGGGAAGGFRTATGQSLTIQNYSVTIGGGGAGAPAGTSTAAGSKGANTVFNTITSTGGGGGGWGEGAGTTGGSGGGSGDLGGAGAAGNQGGYSPVEGFAGGAGANQGGGGGGGGGGGSSAVGSAGSGTTGGNGGAGTSNSYSGSAITYAAGGKGGDAGPAAAGSNGTDNRGNGGGAPKSGTGTGIVGGNGGSGIVIIRYPAV